jgi:hypothetical protein
MPRFRRKATETEAEQWFPGRPMAGVQYDREYTAGDPDGERLVREGAYVVTAHGQRVYLSPGDWVLPEPDGRGFYPVKPDIFAKTWDLVEGS